MILPALRPAGRAARSFRRTSAATCDIRRRPLVRVVSLNGWKSAWVDLPVRSTRFPARPATTPRVRRPQCRHPIKGHNDHVGIGSTDIAASMLAFLRRHNTHAETIESHRGALPPYPLLLHRLHHARRMINGSLAARPTTNRGYQTTSDTSHGMAVDVKTHHRQDSPRTRRRRLAPSSGRSRALMVDRWRRIPDPTSTRRQR